MFSGGMNLSASSNTSTAANPLGSERIGRLIAKFAIPSIISLIFNSIYNIVDQIFIGQKVGYLGNAATNVIFPLTVIGIALAITFGDGGAAYVSLKLGMNERDEASKGAGNSVVMTAVLGILLAIAVSIFLEPICRIIGATELVMPHALEYGRIIAIGLPLSMFAGCTNSIIRADGRPKLSMLSVSVGAAANIILDPIFIFVFEWDMAGAAWATVIGQLLSAIISLICVCKTRNVDINRETLRPRWRTVSKVTSLGTASFINQVAMVVIITLSNILLTHYGAESIYGAEIPLAAHGITMKVNQIVNSVCIGLAAGCQPIIGYNYGAAQFGRVRKTMASCMLITFIVMAAATVVYQLFPMAIIKIFGSESDLYNQFAVKSFRIFLSGTVFAGLHTCCGIFFQSIGKPFLAAVNSLSRQLVFMIPVTIVFARLIGVEGILWSGPVCDTGGIIIAFIFLAREFKLLKREEAAHEITQAV